MDKKAGICTIKAFALNTNSIPSTGLLSYPRRTGYETTIYSFPVTRKTKLSTKPRRLPSDWLGPPNVEIHPDYDNPPSIKGMFLVNRLGLLVITMLSIYHNKQARYILIPFSLADHAENIDPDMIRECNRAIFEGTEKSKPNLYYWWYSVCND